MADPYNSSSVLIPYTANGVHSTGTRLVGVPGPSTAAQPAPPQPQPAARIQSLQSLSSSGHPPEDDPFVGCERYVKKKFIGAGASGKVYVAWDKLEEGFVAIKFLETARIFDKYLEREILNHRELNHPHIIKFKEVIATQHHIGIVMEWASGGTLADYVKRNCPEGLPEELARWIFQQLIFAVDYCHRKGIANRDLKLDNTLLDWLDGQPLPVVKLCDFGYSKSDIHSAATSRVGSLFYMAPEVITNSSNGTYEAKLADVWSCGVMLYRMLFKKWPFVQSTLAGTMQQIVSLQYTIPDTPVVSPACKHLLSCMLAAKEHRVDLATVQQHPWYLTKLLPGVQGLNDQFLAQELSAELQPVDVIQDILRRAQHPQQDLDEYDRLLDQAIESELQKPDSLSLDLSVDMF